MALLVLIFFQQFVDLAPGLNEIGFSIDNTFVSTQASANIEVHECFGPLFDGFGGGAALDVAFLSIPTLTAGTGSDSSFFRTIIGTGGITYVKAEFPGANSDCRSVFRYF